MTASELEDRMFALLRRARLPTSSVNVPLAIGGREIVADFLWPAHWLFAETDGFATHGTRTAFEDDRARDAALLVAGFRARRPRRIDRRRDRGSGDRRIGRQAGSRRRIREIAGGNASRRRGRGR